MHILQYDDLSWGPHHHSHRYIPSRWGGPGDVFIQNLEWFRDPWTLKIMGKYLSGIVGGGPALTSSSQMNQGSNNHGQRFQNSLFTCSVSTFYCCLKLEEN